MEFGSRQIRTAGKGSGSIEVTLPAELRDLVGLPCRVMLRDGARPDIVLQPDLQAARPVFAAVWRAMAAALLADPDDPLPLARFGFGLQPRVDAAEPFLCWRDGLALGRPSPHPPLAVARTLAACGHAMAPSLGVAAAFGAAFGAACGHLCAGVPPAPAWQEACDLAAAGLRGAGSPGAPLQAAESVLAPAFWTLAGPVLLAVVDLFVAWTADPSGHTTLRAAWRRGRSIELSGG